MPNHAATKALDLTESRQGAAPLWLLASGCFASTAAGPAPTGLDAGPVLVNAARWISTRRTSSFERIFPGDAAKKDHLTADQATALLGQASGAIDAAAVGSDAAKHDADKAAQIRSAGLTVLSHILATVVKDASFRKVADASASKIFALIDAETARPALRAHAILLLQIRGPSLNAADKSRAEKLLRSLVREAPPYKDLDGVWNFAMCSDSEFHKGEVNVFVKQHGFKRIDKPSDAPPAPGGFDSSGYDVIEAPFKNPNGKAIRLYARSASPSNENKEMAQEFFIGLLINRHAQLGSFDMRAANVSVHQKGYKLLMNSQCAGMTTRFAITRLFPDADVYASVDSTFFNQDKDGGEVTASEGADCFVAIMQGMAASETHAQLAERVRKAQWTHDQSSVKGFTQFTGPSDPIFIERFQDVNNDGKADYYDGFLDFTLSEIAEDLHSSATPKNPKVAASQIGGEAADGLDWAAGSMDRVAQYSDLWTGLPGASERFYAFQAGGFYSQAEPPEDVATGSVSKDLGHLPAVCRYRKTDDGPAGLTVDVMMHSWLSHSGRELKRMLVAAEAMQRALDLGHIKAEGALATPLGQRGAILLTMAGLLAFPADANFLDGLWAIALQMLNFPDIGRSLVSGCITGEDHDASNYYGSLRGLKQLVGSGSDTGALGKVDPTAHAKLKSSDPKVGRAKPLKVS